ncbi:ABC transporter permease [Thiohalospira sp.]|uniref:ABC transporter permease n=1 Tax=Thiohalospira sp. TaxID=3080549 RepID=UPI00398016ED
MNPRALALILKEFALLGRDRHGLLVLFVMPALFILIMSLALRDEVNDQRGIEIPYPVIDQSESDASRALQRRLEGMDGFRPRLMTDTDPEDMVAAISGDEFKFGVIIPPDFAERLEEGKARDPLPDLVELSIAPGTDPQLRLLFRMVLETAIRSLRADRLLERLSFAPEGDPMESEGLFPAGNLEVSFASPAGEEALIPSAVQQSVPAWLVFAMFFVVIPLSTTFLVERQQGTLLRLASLGVPARLMLVSKVVPYFGINQLQMVLMVLVGMFAVPALGGDALAAPSSLAGLAIISVATSIAALGFALLITTFARTHIQATTYGGIANIILGALGGIMVPRFVMPPFMQDLGLISPMAWGLEGFLDIFLRGGDWTAPLPEAAGLILFGTMALMLAALRLRRGQLQTPTA